MASVVPRHPEVPAHLFRTQSTLAEDVLVRSLGAAIAVTYPDGQEKAFANSELKFSEHIKGVPWRITLPDGATVSVLDESFVHRHGGFKAGFVSLLENHFFKLALPVLALAALALWLTVAVALPALSGFLVAHMSPEWDDRFGDALYEQIADSWIKTDDSEEAIAAQQRLQDLGAEIAVYASPEYNFEFEFFCSEGGGTSCRRLLDPPAELEFLITSSKKLGDNAFALPNGKVVMTESLFEHLDDDQAAAVLAHEIAHVDLRHSAEALVRSSGWFVISQMVLGGAGLVIVPTLAELSFSREDEAEADCMAVKYMILAGRPPEALIGALEVLTSLIEAEKEEEGATEDDEWFSWEDYEYLSTHPFFETRRDGIQECIARFTA